MDGLWLRSLDGEFSSFAAVPSSRPGNGRGGVAPIEKNSSKTKMEPPKTNERTYRANYSLHGFCSVALLVDSVWLVPCWWSLGRSLDGEFSSFAAVRWLGPCSVHWIMIGGFAVVSLVDSWTVFGSVCLAGWCLALHPYPPPTGSKGLLHSHPPKWGESDALNPALDNDFYLGSILMGWGWYAPRQKGLLHTPYAIYGGARAFLNRTFCGFSMG